MSSPNERTTRIQTPGRVYALLSLLTGTVELLTFASNYFLNGLLHDDGQEVFNARILRRYSFNEPGSHHEKRIDNTDPPRYEPMGARERKRE